ncbi:hypothetical protein F4778DRAFT_481529 [Xylariomycetidae sp. FL2044]|nr:hypothetical protein F4778DRAFT_481529 [Xylariomycetidae sp. FL2044]
MPISPSRHHNNLLLGIGASPGLLLLVSARPPYCVCATVFQVAHYCHGYLSTRHCQHRVAMRRSMLQNLAAWGIAL